MKLLKTLLVVIIAASMFSCDSDDKKSSKIQIRLTDAPGDFEEVNITVEELSINIGSSEENWKTVTLAETRSFNLLDLTGGVDALLSEFELESGRIEQLRLKLNEDVNVKVNGVSHTLKVPSGSQSGLKININTEIEEGIDYSILLDFDVAKSIVVTGGGGYILKPVIRASLDAKTGAVKGLITPANVNSVAYAVQNTDTIASAYSNDEGKFFIKGLNEGTYKVIISPASDNYSEVVKENVNVTIGSVTDLETIELTSK